MTKFNSLASADHRSRVAAERRKRMRSRLLRSALRLVAVKGPVLTSIDDVVTAAQVSRGTFYKYFQSPEALIQELAAEIANELIRIAEPAVRNHDDPAVLVARGIRLISQLALHHPAIAQCMVRLGWPDERGIHMLEFVKRDMEAGFRRGRFKRMPMSLALNIVAAVVLGSIQHMLESGCRNDFSKQAAEVALRALGIDFAEADAISERSLGTTKIRSDGWLAETLGEVD